MNIRKILVFLFLILSFNIYSNNDTKRDSICNKNIQIGKIAEKDIPISYYIFIINEDEGIKNLPIFEFNYHINKKTKLTFFNSGIVRNNIYGLGIKRTF